MTIPTALPELAIAAARPARAVSDAAVTVAGAEAAVRRGSRVLE
jgi:hypothetical protein